MFAVGRVLNRFDEMDYICAWDRKWGTAASGLRRALRFATQADAEKAAKKARELVPTWIGGGTIEYRVVQVAA